MLAVSILLYMLLTISLGVVAARRVHGAKDFMVAGRSLPLAMSFTCVFATWFGAETVLSVSATFTKGGLNAIPGDPFGASMCLMLVAIFFARHFYRMDLLTIGDFYHKRYGKGVEIFTSIAITLSYLGWTAAQLTALGLVMSVLGTGLGMTWMTLNNCIIIGSFIVLFYTVLGGMWSVALTDVIQTIVIIIGLIAIVLLLGNMAGGFGTVIEAARDQGKFEFFPKGGLREWIAFLTAFITVALGSIPQQDVFQRVTSAKNERTAFLGTFLGGVFYFFFAFVPMFIAFSAVLISPELTDVFNGEDERAIQSILPQLILDKTPFWAQVLFFGALLSAIMSTASGTLLAPSSLFVENVLRPSFRGKITEGNMLVIVRSTLIVFAALATYQAVTSNKTMYAMVQGAYSVTLVGAFVPLALGLYWHRATNQGAILSIFCGMSVWALSLFFLQDNPEQPLPSYSFGMIPPQLAGLIASLTGMIVGSLSPQLIANHGKMIERVEYEISHHIEPKED
ncbi:MAG: sodium:solute symporter family protein [Pirellulales bacterium]